VLGPDWTALNHTVYFMAYGDTAEEAFTALVAGLREGYWYAPWQGDTLVALDPERSLEDHIARRGFVRVEESSATIAQRLISLDGSSTYILLEYHNVCMSRGCPFFR